MMHVKQLLSAVAIAVLGISASARAQTLDTSAKDTPVPSAADQAQSGAFLPDVSTARAGAGVGVGFFVAGYDKATASPMFVASVQAVLFSRLALSAGGAYVPSGSNPSMQPQLELRWLLTTQERSGIDSAVGLVYRRDKITQDGGIGQAIVSLGHRFGSLGTVANVAYGQDDEGDDRLTELRLAGLYRLREAWVVGAMGTAATGFGSTDSRRAARGEANYELQLGPTGSYNIGKWALLAQTGIDSVRTTRTSSGLFAFGGIGSAF